MEAIIQPVVQSIWIPATVPKLSAFPAFGDCISDFRFNSSEAVQKSCMYKHLANFPAWERSVDGNLGQKSSSENWIRFSSATAQTWASGFFWYSLFPPFVSYSLTSTWPEFYKENWRDSAVVTSLRGLGFYASVTTRFLTLRRRLNIPDFPFVKNQKLCP